MRNEKKDRKEDWETQAHRFHASSDVEKWLTMFPSLSSLPPFLSPLSDPTLLTVSTLLSIMSSGIPCTLEVFFRRSHSISRYQCSFSIHTPPSALFPFRPFLFIVTWDNTLHIEFHSHSRHSQESRHFLVLSFFLSHSLSNFFQIAQRSNWRGFEGRSVEKKRSHCFEILWNILLFPQSLRSAFFHWDSSWQKGRYVKTNQHYFTPLIHTFMMDRWSVDWFVGTYVDIRKFVSFWGSKNEYSLKHCHQFVTSLIHLRTLLFPSSPERLPV